MYWKLSVTTVTQACIVLDSDSDHSGDSIAAIFVYPLHAGCSSAVLKIEMHPIYETNWPEVNVCFRYYILCRTILSKNLQEEMSALDFLDYDEDEEEEDDDHHEEESGIINDDQSRTVVVHLWVKTLLKVKWRFHRGRLRQSENSHLYYNT